MFIELFKEISNKNNYSLVEYKIDRVKLLYMLSELGSKTNLFGSNSEVIQLATQLNLNKEYIKELLHNTQLIDDQFYQIKKTDNQKAKESVISISN